MKIFDEFMNISSLIQIGVCFVILFLSVYMTKPLLSKISLKGKVFDIVEPLIMPVSFFITSGIICLIGNNFTKVKVLEMAVISSGLWVVLRFVSGFIGNKFLGRIAAFVAWLIAFLLIAGWMDESTKILQDISFKIGKSEINMFSVVKMFLTLGILICITRFSVRIVERTLEKSRELSSTSKVLLSKLYKYVAYSAAIFISIQNTNIDLTVFAVLTAPIGLGIGFGFQKPAANLVCGLLVVLDGSIKPGDIIEVSNPSGGSTYGTVYKLTARSCVIVTLDGKYHIIPNEELLTQKVVNWSHGSSLVRANVMFEVENKLDPKTIADFAVEAAQKVQRVVKKEETGCSLIEIKGYSFVFRVDFWLSDPENGITNIKSDILIELWKMMKEQNINVPIYQQNIVIEKRNS